MDYRRIRTLFIYRLYRFNKFLFFGFALLIFGSLYINFKQGLTVYPIIHYGMYSGVYHKSKIYTLPQIVVNGDSNFDISQCSTFDQESLIFFFQEYESNDININNKHGYFQRKGLRKAILRAPRSNIFNEFLLDYASNVLRVKVKFIGYYKKNYIYKDQKIAIKIE